MSGGSAITSLTQKRAVFPVFSSREVTLGQMRKIGIHFIIYRDWPVPYKIPGCATVLPIRTNIGSYDVFSRVVELNDSLCKSLNMN